MSTTFVDAGRPQTSLRLRGVGMSTSAVARRIASWLVAAICVGLLVKVLLGVKLVPPLMWGHMDLWRQAYVVCFRSVSEACQVADYRLPAVTIACCVICGFGGYICAVAPATQWDVLHYHLGVPVIYLARGGFVPLNNSWAVHAV